MTYIGNSAPMTTEFWMVYGEGQRAPTHKHDTLASAEIEAGRLADQHPGIAFYVLKARSAAFAPQPVATGWKLKKRAPVGEHPDDDGMPF